MQNLNAKYGKKTQLFKINLKEIDLSITVIAHLGMNAL